MSDDDKRDRFRKHCERARCERALAGCSRLKEIMAALENRVDLVHSEFRIIREWQVSHRVRWEILAPSSYGCSGGTAGDRRLVAEGLAKLEESAYLPGWYTLVCRRQTEEAYERERLRRSKSA